MIRQLFLLSSIASLDAFLAPPTLHQAPCSSVASSWSPLRSDATPEGGEAAAEEAAAAEDHLLPSEDASDILNSPAFLKRKVEVLQSDIAALEKEIEEANAVYNAGKEEWGAKFDMLNKEVSAYVL